MQDLWYSDKRDLIKWGVLLRLAAIFEAGRILQLAFYRPSDFDQLEIDGQTHEIPEEVIAHFRNVRTIGNLPSKVRVTVFDPVFQERATHVKAAVALLLAFAQERCIVFLDPDTGLAPQTPSLNHVLASEARSIWDGMKVGDVFVIYQHQTNRAGQPWMEPKRSELAAALGISTETVKKASRREVAPDVVLFYAQKL